MALEHDTQVLAKQILEDLKPELVLPSPYSVWDPGKMKLCAQIRASSLAGGMPVW